MFKWPGEAKKKKMTLLVYLSRTSVKTIYYHNTTV